MLRLTAKCTWADAMPLRPDSADSGIRSPFPAQMRPKCGTKCGPASGPLYCLPFSPPFTQSNCWHNFTDVLCRRAWAAANDALLFHELRRRWTNGVIRFNVGSGHARSVLSYLQNKHNYDAKGFLRLGTLRVGGFNNEYRSQASRFDKALQWRHSRHFSNRS